MEFSVQQIANLVKGTVEGDTEGIINYVSKIEEGKPGTLSFLANPKYIKYIYETKSTAVLVSNDFVAEQEVTTTLIRVENPYVAIASLLEYYNANYNEKTGVSDMAFVHESAKIGKNVYVAPFAYVGENAEIGSNAKIYPHAYVSENVKVGENTWLAAGVKIYNDCRIGSHCILHAGAVIGSDGFGFVPNSENNYQKIPQIGIVIIEDYVEVGANTTIDRATMGETIIRKGVKLDNLIQIGHNVDIGENTVIASQAGISGSTKIGKECMIGGQVGFAGHLVIADKTNYGAQSGIAASVDTVGGTHMGSPSMDLRSYQRSAIVFKHLPEMRMQIRQLEKQLEQLKKQISM